MIPGESGWQIDPLIITITYNPSEELLSRLFVPNYKGVVIDNSEVVTLWLQEFCLNNDIKYIANKKNLGIAKALNLGCQYAYDNGYQWAVTMDQDSLISPEILENLAKFIQEYSNHNEMAIVSPRHIVESKYTVVPDNLLNQEYVDGIFTMTSGNWVNLHIWYKLHGFNEGLFIDMVDVDYYCRAIIEKYKVLTVNNIIMHHGLGTNARRKVIFGTIFDVLNHNAIRKYYQIRNSFYIYAQYADKVPYAEFILKFAIKLFISTLLFENKKIKKILYMIRGYIDYRRNKLGQLDI